MDTDPNLEQVERLEAKIDELNRRVSDLETETDALNMLVTELESDTGDQKARIKELEAALERVNLKLIKVRDARDNLNDLDLDEVE